jgi:hypothetical protein
VEVEFSRLYDLELSKGDINILTKKIFDARTQSPLYISGVFISYSHDDSKFVDKVHDLLYEQRRGLARSP